MTAVLRQPVGSNGATLAKQRKRPTDTDSATLWPWLAGVALACLSLCGLLSTGFDLQSAPIGGNAKCLATAPQEAS